MSIMIIVLKFYEVQIKVYSTVLFISLISALLDLYILSYIASSTVCKVSGASKFQGFRTEHKMMSTNLVFRQLTLCKSVCICLAKSCPLLFMQICSTKLVELKLAMLDTGRIQTASLIFQQI